jgi:N-acylglucosamine-6-phosphate 2-epimerase
VTWLETLRGGLIVSVQVHDVDDPVGEPRTIAAIASSVAASGAAGIRCGGLGGPIVVEAVAAAVDVPVIGMWKDPTAAVQITPTIRHALAVAAAGAHIVAFDGTDRPRPDNETVAALIDAVHGAGLLAMADVATLADARRCEDSGADVVATTLAGYADGNMVDPSGPDVRLVRALSRALAVPVVAEGRYSTPLQVRAAFEAGAHSVVVGRAITSPAWLTRVFLSATSPQFAEGQPVIRAP